jgi:hypothetical protein
MRPPRFTLRRLMVAVAIVGMLFWIWSLFFWDDSSGFMIGVLLYGLVLLVPIGAVVLLFLFLGMLMVPRDPPPR